MFKWLKELWLEIVRAYNEDCPVCGYYCLGSGGIGCIDKPKQQYAQKENEHE